VTEIAETKIQGALSSCMQVGALNTVEVNGWDYIVKIIIAYINEMITVAKLTTYI
jgi:hypothetical protein